MLEKSSWKRLTALLFCFLAIEVVFFRGVLLNPNNLIGDGLDGKFNNLILEHWFGVLQGWEAPLDLRIFWPTPVSLGYSDALLGLAFPYVLLRSLGLDMFFANKIVLILMHAVGSVGTYLLLRRRFHLQTKASLIGVILFSLSSAYGQSVGHAQLFMISAVPLLLYPVFGFLKNFSSNRFKRIRDGVLSIFGFGFLLLTSFYIGYFSFLFLVCFLLVYIGLEFRAGRLKLRLVPEFLKGNWAEIVIYAMAFVLVLIPLYAIYGHSYRTFGGRSWTEVSYMLPQWVDLFNTSSGSWLWHSAFDDMLSNLNSRPYAWELRVGWPFLTLALVSVATWVAVWQRDRKTNERRNSDTLVFSLAVAALVLVVLSLKVDGFSLWWFVFEFVPGGSAIRAVVRIFLFATLPFAILVAVHWDRIFQKIPNRLVAQLLFLLLASVVLVDNLQRGAPTSSWSRTTELAFLETVPPPPVGVETFYIMNVDGEDTMYRPQMAAWLIAAKYNLKTINGYSGQFPNKGWPNPGIRSPDYQKNMENWIQEKQLKNVAVYNVSSREWLVNRRDASMRIWFSRLEGDMAKPYRLGAGWSNSEDWGCWTLGSKASLQLPDADTRKGLRLRFEAVGFTEKDPLRVGLFVEGADIGSLLVGPDAKIYEVLIPDSVVPETAPVVLDFMLQNPQSPLKMGASEDSRELGLGIKWMTVDSIERDSGEAK